MKILLIESDACPVQPEEFDEGLLNEADLIIERFAPFVPFLLKAPADTDLVELRRSYAKDQWYQLPGTFDRTVQGRSNPTVIRKEA